MNTLLWEAERERRKTSWVGVRTVCIPATLVSGLVQLIKNQIAPTSRQAFPISLTMPPARLPDTREHFKAHFREWTLCFLDGGRWSIPHLKEPCLDISLTHGERRGEGKTGMRWEQRKRPDDIAVGGRKKSTGAFRRSKCIGVLDCCLNLKMLWLEPAFWRMLTRPPRCRFCCRIFQSEIMQYCTVCYVVAMFVQ